MIHECWICFCDTGKHKNRIFKKGFGHVAIIMCDQFNWIRLYPRNNQLSIKILGFDPKTTCVPQMLLNDGEFSHVLNVTYKVIDKINIPNLSFLHIINCVGITKYILGINWVMAFTPFQFFKYLKKIESKKKFETTIINVRELTKGK